MSTKDEREKMVQGAQLMLTLDNLLRGILGDAVITPACSKLTPNHRMAQHLTVTKVVL